MLESHYDYNPSLRLDNSFASTKMALHPFCHKISLRTGTKAVSVMYLSASIWMIVSGVIVVSSEGEPIALEELSTEVSEVTTNSKYLGNNTSIAGAVGIIVSLLLFQGARTKSVWKIRVFLIMQFVDLLGFARDSTNNQSSSAYSVFGFVLVTYTVWIVESFMREIQLEQQSGV